MTARKYEKPNVGIECPQCGEIESAVEKSQPFQGHFKRTRRCLKCLHKWSTIEIPYDQFVAFLALTKHWAKGPTGTNMRRQQETMFIIPNDKRVEYHELQGKGFKVREIGPLLGLQPNPRFNLHQRTKRHVSQVHLHQPQGPKG